MKKNLLNRLWNGNKVDFDSIYLLKNHPKLQKNGTAIDIIARLRQKKNEITSYWDSGLWVRGANTV